MLKNHLLDCSSSLLLIVDVQEKLAPHILEIDMVTRNIASLVGVAGELGVPILITEQYSAGLGHTVMPISGVGIDHGASTFEKNHFNATREGNFCDAIRRYGKKNVIMCGTEAHVCVLQTAMGLLEMGVCASIVADAVSSRKAFDRDIGLDRLQHAGAKLVTTEMVMFEWLERADTDVFRRVLPTIRGLKGA